MIIRELNVQEIRIPLDIPKRFGGAQVAFRDYVIVTITTQSGWTGWSFIWSAPGVSRVIEAVSPQVVGESAANIRGIWDKVYRHICKWGRGGIGMRALAGIDNALWDIAGKAAGMPIYRLLGACRSEIPAYHTGGYLPVDCTAKYQLIDFHQREVASIVEKDFPGYKMKIGASDVEFDLMRIAMAREGLGPGRKLMVDCNCSYDPETIIAMARRFEQYGVEWVEEPAALDDLPNYAYVAAHISMPVALGENHYTCWDLRNLLDYKAGRIIQCDPIVAGGITQYIAIAGTARTYGVKLAPHCFHDFNIQVALAFPEVITLEYMDESDDVFNIQRIIENPVLADHGMLRAPQGPGNGLILRQDLVERYKL